MVAEEEHNHNSSSSNSSSLLDAKMKILIDEFGLEACQASLTKHANSSTCSSSEESSSPKKLSESITTTTAALDKQVKINQAIVEASFHPLVVINDHGIIQKVNQSLLSKFGYDHEDELISKNINILCGKDYAPHHNKWMEKYRQTRESHIMGSLRQVKARRKNGTEFPVQLGIEMIELDDKDSNGEGRGGELMFVGFIRDLSQDKMMEREHRMNQAIIDASFHPLVVIDDHGIIQKVNQSLLSKFGYDHEDELVNSNISMLCGKDYAAHHDRFMANYRRTGESHIMGTQREVKARRKDGTEFPVQLGIEEIKSGEADGTARVFVGFIRDLTKEKENLELTIEKRAAEQLLFNMLPEEVANRLKADPSSIADHFQSATILFADIVGFTSMSSTMNPVEVVNLLNDLFSRFDEILDLYGLNKIKTIGDCYMVTSIPGPDIGHKECAAVCHFGLDMIHALHDYNEENPERPLDLRVGINCGPVVAGVVGTKRFLYDVWGDAVNLASRMESTGVPGRIQVSKAVVDSLASWNDDFRFESRGQIHVKGKGAMETFLMTERVKGATDYHVGGVS